MVKIKPVRFAACFVALLLVGGSSQQRIVCATPQTDDDYFPGSEWRTSVPQEQGLDKKLLKKLIKRIRRNDIPGIDSLLIARNGYLVTEEYFNGWGPDDLHTLQSDSKSVTSLFVGIALSQGKISSIDEPVLGFFPE